MVKTAIVHAAFPHTNMIDEIAAYIQHGPLKLWSTGSMATIEYASDDIVVLMSFDDHMRGVLKPMICLELLEKDHKFHLYPNNNKPECLANYFDTFIDNPWAYIATTSSYLVNGLNANKLRSYLAYKLRRANKSELLKLIRLCAPIMPINELEEIVRRNARKSDTEVYTIIDNYRIAEHLR